MHTARHSIATAGAIAGMTNTQLAAVLGHSQTHTTERYSAIARSRQQRLGSLAFGAAMGTSPSHHARTRAARMSLQFVNDIPMDGDQLTVEELQDELLQVIMRLAGQLRNVRNPSALARTLHWLKNQEVKRPRGRPPQHTVGADRPIEELHHAIIEIALRLAGEANAKTKWRGLHRALRHFRSEADACDGGKRASEREPFRLHMLIEMHRKPGETNVRCDSPPHR